MAGIFGGNVPVGGRINVEPLTDEEKAELKQVLIVEGEEVVARKKRRWSTIVGVVLLLAGVTSSYWWRPLMEMLGR